MLPPPTLLGRRVLVLGATGFIGRWVARCAARAGADCLLQARSAAALAVLREPYDLRGAERIVDLAEPGAVEELLEAEPCDLVLNLVGYGVDRSERDETLAVELNERLPQRIAAALAGSATRLVHVGSALEYGAVGGDLDEEGGHRATTLYGRTKLAATRALADLRRRDALDCLTVRLFTVYGPGEHAGRLLPALIAATASGDAVELSAGLQRRDFDQVEEVAHGLLALGAGPRPADPVINLARGRLESVREFCLAAARVFGLAEEKLLFGRLPTRAEEMSHEAVSTERLQRALGRPLELGLEAGLLRTREFIEETK